MIDASDASEILNMYAGLSTQNLAISTDEFKRYDIDSNGGIDVNDASGALA